MHDNMMSLVASISKIKIGKVELTSPKKLNLTDTIPCNPDDDKDDFNSK